MVKVIHLDKKFTNKNHLGKFLDEDAFDVLITEDADVYKPANPFDDDSGEGTVLLKFRKQVFSKEMQKAAYEGLKDGATASHNRGTAAGDVADPTNLNGSKDRGWVTDYQMAVLDYFMQPSVNKLMDSDDDLTLKIIRKKFKGKETEVLSRRGQVWLGAKITSDGWNFDTWATETEKKSKSEQIEEARGVIEEYISGTSYANAVFSGVGGYYDRYPRTPYCRETAYTMHNKEKFERSIPFVEGISNWFGELLPARHKAQKAAIEKIDPTFRIGESVYTTLTLNRNFRTAAHTDSGDLTEGFGNLTTLSNGKEWSGGYLCFPEYRVAVDIRPGDVLLMDVHEIHGNTPLKPIEGEEKPERISVVAYFRENMFGCSMRKIEDLRRDFVVYNKTDKEDTHWRENWNGVFPAMFESEKWLQYLLNRGEKEIYDQEKLRIHGFERVTFEDMFE